MLYKESFSTGLFLEWVGNFRPLTVVSNGKAAQKQQFPLELFDGQCSDFHFRVEVNVVVLDTIHSFYISSLAYLTSKSIHPSCELSSTEYYPTSLSLTFSVCVLRQPR